MEKARKELFTINGENDIFSGYTTGYTWNGFECPYFTLETLKEIIEAYKLKKIKYDKANDTYYYMDLYDKNYSYLASGKDIETEGGLLHLYYCGGSWVWEKYKNDN